jgi:hypothetical protein
LALLAQGNTEALNYLPRIGKLKTLGQTIVFDDAANTQEAANNLSIKRFHEILSDVLSTNYKTSSFLIQNNNLELNKTSHENEIINIPQKSFFT